MTIPVVFLHAFPLDSRIWIEQAQALSDHYQAIVPDLRGFGSAYDQLAGLTEISIDLVADDVARLLDQRGIEIAVIGGISRGGYAALAFARKYPQRLRGLMLFDTRANPADNNEKQTYSDLRERLAKEGIEAAVDMMKTRLLGPTTLALNPALIAKINGIIRSQHVDAVSAAAIGMVNRSDARPTLPTIKVPTLAIAGVDDAAFENTRAIVDSVPGAQFVAVPDAGHLSILEQPALVTKAMRAFLDQLT